MFFHVSSDLWGKIVGVYVINAGEIRPDIIRVSFHAYFVETFFRRAQEEVL